MMACDPSGNSTSSDSRSPDSACDTILAPAGKGDLAFQRRPCRDRDVGDGHLRGGDDLRARLVDNRAHDRHKGEEQKPEIDRDEADKLLAHLFDRRVERLLLFVIECGPYHENYRAGDGSP